MVKSAKADKTNQEGKDMPDAEQQYIGINNYLTLPSSHTWTELSTYIVDTCMQYGLQVIDYCTWTLNSEKRFTKYPTWSPYKDDLLNGVIFSYINTALNRFQDTIQLVFYYNAGKDWVNFLNYYGVQDYPPFWVNHIANILSKAISMMPLDRVGKAEGLIQSIISNPLYVHFCSFCPYFKKAWKFLYGDNPPLFMEGTWVFHNLGEVVDIFWKGTESAAQFFSKNLPFNSLEETSKAFSFFEQITFNPGQPIPQTYFWDWFPKILQSLLLQILKKVIEDNVPIILEHLRPQFSPQQEAFS